jgi:hypothetical protein
VRQALAAGGKKLEEIENAIRGLHRQRHIARHEKFPYVN